MKRVLKILISAGFLGLALYILDWEALKSALFELNPIILVLVTVFLVSEYVILGARWFLLINPIASLGYVEHLRRYMLAVFFSSVTPAQLGGDAYRFFSIKGEGGRALDVFSILVRERFLGLVSFILFFLLCLLAHLWATDWADITWSNVFVSSGVLLAAGFVVAIPISKALERLDAASLFAERPAINKLLSVSVTAVSLRPLRLVSRVLMLGLLAALVWGLAIVWLSHDLGLPITLAAAGMVGILADLIRLIPVTVQGIGVREATFAYLFDQLGYSPEIGFIVGTVAYLAVSLSLILAGAIGGLMTVQKATIDADKV